MNKRKEMEKTSREVGSERKDELEWQKWMQIVTSERASEWMSENSENREKVIAKINS